MRFLDFVAGAALFALAACAMPPVDREMLAEMGAGQPVRLEGARGPLSYQQSRAILDDLKKRSPETSIFDEHVAVEESIAGNPLSVGNRATLLEDGEATYAAMLAAIRSAKHHVHLETYIYEQDEIGRKFADALIERRKAGVKVRLIYDSYGSKNTPRAFFDDLRTNGIDVVEFNPADPANLLTLRINQRDHRKLLIVDGRIAFLGGINISSVYASDSSVRAGDKPFDQRPWRDTHIQVEGPVVGDLQRSFIAHWNKQRKENLDETGLLPKLSPAGSLVIRALEGSGDDRLNPLYVTFLSAIAAAQTEVHITVAYFVPDPRLLEELKAAAQRGVDVKLILPSRTDNWVVFNAGRSFYEELLESGVKIYERKNRLLHSKTAAIDGVWSTVGSTNLDWRSLLHNEELNVVILGPEFGGRMEALFARDLANSELVTREKWRSRPLQHRVRELGARAWAFLL